MPSAPPPLEAPRPGSPANESMPEESAVELAPALVETEPPSPPLPRARPEHVAPPSQPGPPVPVPTVASDAVAEPPPEKGEGHPASKVAVVPSASQGAAHPVVAPVAATRAEALVSVDAPPPPVAPASIPDQIVSAVVPLHGRGDGRHEITLELRPDDLGIIRVEVSVEHQTVHLTFHAAEPATSRLLSAALPDLRTALADAGLTAGQVGVGVDGGDGTGHRRSEPQAVPEARLAETESRPSTTRSARPAAAGRIDLFL